MLAPGQRLRIFHHGRLRWWRLRARLGLSRHKAGQQGEQANYLDVRFRFVHRSSSGDRSRSEERVSHQTLLLLQMNRITAGGRAG